MKKLHLDLTSNTYLEFTSNTSNTYLEFTSNTFLAFTYDLQLCLDFT